MGDLEAKYQPLANEEGPGDPDPEGFKNVADFMEHRLLNNTMFCIKREQGDWELIHTDGRLELRWNAFSRKESAEGRKIMDSSHMHSIMGRRMKDGRARFIMNNGHYVDVTVQKCTMTFTISGVYADVCEIEPKEQEQVKMPLAETRSEAKATGEGPRQGQAKDSGAELRQRAKQNAQSYG
jgi:hypothetical protein